MRRNRIWLTCGVLVLALATAGCAKVGAASESSGDPAARLVETDGSELAGVVLSDRAEARIGLETARVGTTVVYAALVYAPDGATFVYTRPAKHTYRRTPVEVADIQGDEVTLSSGPAAGTEVVTVGSAELFGVEQGIGG